MESIQAIKGMNDILPGDIELWQEAEKIARQVLETFGYREIRTPLLEKLELFARGIGETTDVVEKEMYAFTDSKGEWLALRPEATASIVRAFIQHNLQADVLTQKLFAIGPMFRHERPQKGRYRQFHQIDAEVFGVDDPSLDAEIMFMLRLYLEKLGLSGVALNINTLGCGECRRAYRGKLQDYLNQHAERLCPDCLRRKDTNPLRAFDCKVERCKEVVSGAPLLIESVCGDCAAHFEKVKEHLERLDTPFVVNPRMVRGLDYYMRTTFEIITDQLGAQNAVGGGGRYNGLVRDLGGPDMAGIGFALGMERLILLLKKDRSTGFSSAGVFLASLGEAARGRIFLLAQQLRVEGIRAELDHEGRSLKSQMRRADKLGTRYVLILGQDELERGEIQLRDMQEKSQIILPLDATVRSLVEKVRAGTLRSPGAVESDKVFSSQR